MFDLLKKEYEGLICFWEARTEKSRDEFGSTDHLGYYEGEIKNVVSQALKDHKRYLGELIPLKVKRV